MADQIPPSERRRILGILTKRKLPKPPKPPPPFQWVAIRVGTMEEDPAQTGQGTANYTPAGAEETP